MAKDSLIEGALNRRSAFLERITDRTTAVLVALTVAWIAARWLS